MKGGSSVFKSQLSHLAVTSLFSNLSFLSLILHKLLETIILEELLWGLNRKQMAKAPNKCLINGSYSNYPPTRVHHYTRTHTHTPLSSQVCLLYQTMNSWRTFLCHLSYTVGFNTFYSFNKYVSRTFSLFYIF